MTVLYEAYNTKCARFNGMADLYDFINKNESKHKWETIERCKRRDSWSGNKTYKEAKEQIIYGDNDYTQYFIDGLKSVSEESDQNSGIGFDVEGDSYDMGSVIQGIPECCIRQDTLTAKKHIKIVVALGFSCGVEANHIKNRGIAIFNLINTLILQGYIVDLSFIEYAGNNRKSSEGDKDGNSLMVVDMPNNAICISSIAYLCSVQFFRIIALLVSDMITGKYYCDGSNNGYKTQSLKKELNSGEYFYLSDGYDNEDFNGQDYSTVKKAINKVTELFNDYCKKVKKSEKN